MTRILRLLCVLLTLSVCPATVRAQLPSPSAECITLDQMVRAEVANGRRAETETLLSQVLAPGASRTAHSCAGLVLASMAIQMSVSGQFGEAEKLAERSIRILEEIYPPDDPVFLRPLHILASARFEHGEIGRTREAFKRMQTIRIERPENRAMLSGLSATLLCVEGRYSEAESEYLAALRAWAQAGRGNMADTGTVLNALGSLYIREDRLDEARQVVDRALNIFTSAKDAVPLDRFKLLHVRAVIHVRRQEWHDAEQDLSNAIAMVDILPALDPSILTRVLADYAYVLRKNHRRQEARTIEARAASLRSQSVTRALIDTTELRARSKRLTK
jgi:tetratricopeptide (TPR) repeat protein